MITTRSWLNEFVPLGKMGDAELVDLFVRIGHEVANYEKIDFDAHIVVGKVLAKEKHPSADKLSVCEVDIGAGKLTIVCGAKNVEAGQFVPVATIGAKMPNGLEIKDAELRGVKSRGMICSAKELGLPDLNDGILPLDSSIGDLKLGKKLRDYPAIADTIFEIELTANRGDCMSVYGLARDLAAELAAQITPYKPARRDDSAMGIGRILRLVSDPEATASVTIRAFENNGFDLPLLPRLRLAWIGAESKKSIDRAAAYATHATGVLFRAYDISSLCKSGAMHAELRLMKKDGLNILYSADKERAIDAIGVRQEADFEANDNSRLAAIAAFFVPPEEISKNAFEKKLGGDALFSRACKGSETDLARGMRFFGDLIVAAGRGRFYAESLSYEPRVMQKTIGVDSREVSALVGAAIDKNKIADILKRLGASVHTNGDQQSFLVTPPAWRHDLQNSADLTEEIVRIMGIDSIESKPLASISKRNATEGWKRWRFERVLAKRAAASGFNESLHFAFCDREAANDFGFKPMDKKLDIANPIAANLNALRPTLLINLLEAAARNRAKGRRSIALFEIGDIYDAKRVQSREIAFVFSGEKEAARVENGGKPRPIELFEFGRLVAGAIGEFSLEPNCEKYLQAGQSALILVNQKPVGEIGKLAPHLIKRFDLDAATFVARVDLGKIEGKTYEAKPFSKLQPIERDLSVVVAKTVAFGDLKKSIAALAIADLKTVSAIDRYEDESLGDKRSITIRLALQPNEKSLTEEEIAQTTNRVLARLKEEFGAELR